MESISKQRKPFFADEVTAAGPSFLTGKRNSMQPSHISAGNVVPMPPLSNVLKLTHRHRNNLSNCTDVIPAEALYNIRNTSSQTPKPSIKFQPTAMLREKKPSAGAAITDSTVATTSDYRKKDLD